MEEKQLKPIPKFRPHGAECKNCGNWMLDCEYTRQEERDNLIRCINNYLDEKQLETQNN